MSIHVVRCNHITAYDTMPLCLSLHIFTCCAIVQDPPNRKEQRPCARRMAGRKYFNKVPPIFHVLHTKINAGDRIGVEYPVLLVDGCSFDIKLIYVISSACRLSYPLMAVNENGLYIMPSTRVSRRILGQHVLSSEHSGYPNEFSG